MSEVPEGLYYTKEHEWMRVEGDTVTIGITDHAQDMLTDIVYIELPEEGDVVGITYFCASCGHLHRCKHGA